ncbi:MAG: right-handed parallel beta-helix repeat-containing protein [Deltaproteobacteria bacterium]|nr:right-handed parallel beta-helix repeat-containing protein [Deltaproteobacteria bacterium]
MRREHPTWRGGVWLLATSLAWAACGGDDVGPADGVDDGAAEADAEGGADADAPDDADAADDTRDDAADDGDAGPCVDVDGDGACRDEDCDDENAAIHPGAAEVCHNGLDDDCDGTADEECLEGSRAFYVDRDSLGGPCADTNPGTLTAPWCTVAHANATLVAGDTVYLRAGTYAGETIQPASSGTSDAARIAYAAHGDEVATFTESVYCVRLQSRSYVTIRGLRFVDCERNLYLQASSHVNVGYCQFDNPGGPTTWAGSRIYEGSTDNRIHNCVFSRYGDESGSAGAWDDNACILDIGNDNVVDESDRNLVVHSAFFHGGHHALGVYANRNVVRGCTFHNEEWYACHRTEAGGRCGNRNVILNASFPETNVRNVIDRNAIAFSGLPADNDSSTGLSVRTQDNIIRRNAFYHNDSSGLGLSADGGNHNDASGNHIYANVFLHNGYPIADDWAPLQSGLMLARWVDDAAHNPMVGVAIKNNVFHDNQTFSIYYYYVDEAEQFVGGNREEAGDPGFVAAAGVPDPFDFEFYDFHLAPGSPCIDAGEFLTRTSNAGTDATVLEVEDAGYFTDGEGLVAGDLIQLEGQARAVRITAVDDAAGTLTIDTPLTWAAGTGVALPYSGIRPDQGIHESS